MGGQIGDEGWVPTNGRDDRTGDAERETPHRVELERDKAELAQIQDELKRLHELRRRIAQRQLEPGDRDIFLALIDEAMETM